MKNSQLNLSALHLARMIFAISFVFSFSCAGLQHGKLGQKETAAGELRQFRTIERINMNASFRGKVHFEDEQARFAGVMRIVDGSKARFEIFSSLGKTRAVLLIADDTLSFYLPENNTLLRGRASLHNIGKIIGMGVEPEHLMNILTGVAQYDAAFGKGDFSIEGNSATGSLSSFSEFREMLKRCGEIVLSYNLHDADTSLRVVSMYDVKQDLCRSLVPTRITISEKGRSLAVDMFLEDVKDLEVFTDNGLFCKRVSSPERNVNISEDEEDIFSDRSLLEISGAEVSDLDRYEPARPILQQMYDGNPQ